MNPQFEMSNTRITTVKPPFNRIVAFFWSKSKKMPAIIAAHHAKAHLPYMYLHVQHSLIAYFSPANFKF